MKLIALMPVRNEDWILGASLRAVLAWCDEIVVLDHCSTDRTLDITLEVSDEYPGRVHRIAETSPVWREMSHRQRLLETAREHNATHIAIVDADEILTGNLLPVIRQQIEVLRPGESLDVQMFAMWRGLNQYRIGSSVWSNRNDLTLAFADDLTLNWKAVNGYDHHSRRPHGARRVPTFHREGGVMHLQWASWRRLTAKHARYKMDERIKYPDKPVLEIDRMYSLALDETNLVTSAVPKSWWEPYARLREKINLDTEPWQEKQCRLWMAEHGHGMFEGLNLFGVT